MARVYINFDPKMNTKI